MLVQVVTDELRHLASLLDVLRKCFSSEIKVSVLSSEVFISLYVVVYEYASAQDVAERTSSG